MEAPPFVLNSRFFSSSNFKSFLIVTPETFISLANSSIFSLPFLLILFKIYSCLSVIVLVAISIKIEYKNIKYKWAHFKLAEQARLQNIEYTHWVSLWSLPAR